MKNKKWLKILQWLVMLLYIAVLVYFMFFAEILGRTSASGTYRYNLVPFREIKRFWHHFRQLGMAAVLANIVGNVAAFMPFGFCLPMLAKHRLHLISCTLYTFGLSLCIECIQLVSKVGSFDVDDLILNTLGGVLGYLAFLCWKKWRRIHKKGKKDETV